MSTASEDLVDKVSKLSGVEDKERVLNYIMAYVNNEFNNNEQMGKLIEYINRRVALSQRMEREENAPVEVRDLRKMLKNLYAPVRNMTFYKEDGRNYRKMLHDMDMMDLESYDDEVADEVADRLKAVDTMCAEIGFLAEEMADIFEVKKLKIALNVMEEYNRILKDAMNDLYVIWERLFKEDN